MIPDMVPMAPPIQMTGRRKAALIVQMLISDGGELALNKLPEPLQELLARELGAIRLVDRDTVNAVAEEFIDLLGAIGLSAPGNPVEALDAISAHLSPELAGRLKAEIGGMSSADPWVQLAGLEVEQLTPILLAESIEVSAVVLSKLPVAKAAVLLGALPGERARRITYAVSQTAEIKPALVSRIGTALVATYCTVKITAFDKPPPDRVGAILNSTQSATRESVLEGLESDDEVFAKDVRKKIFTFEDIPARIVPTDIPPCLREVAPEKLSLGIAAALASPGPLQDAAEFIFANISKRMAAQLREDAEELSPVKHDVGEEAMNAITTGIRDLVDSGAILMLDPDTEEEQAA